MIYRTWICLNRNCLRENTVADADHPPCPYCGGRRVKWLPKPVATRSAKTQQIDATVRELQQGHGNKNFNSPRRDERMEPRYNPPLGSHTTQITPAGMPGWTTTVPVNPQTGAVMTSCYNAPVTAPLKVERERGYAGAQRLKPVPHVDQRHHFGTQADIARR